MDKKKIFYFLLLLIGFILTLISFEKTKNPAYLGIGTFITLFIVFYLNNNKLDTGEMRRTIAGSMILTFYGLMETGNAKLQEILYQHFWQIVLAIVGFYFTSRMVNNIFNRG